MLHNWSIKFYRNKFIYRLFGALSIILIFLFAFFMLFISSEKVVNIWDEAIYANNALEMFLNRKYCYYTINNKVDYYNTKPPLALYTQVASYYIFGVNTFSLRFSSYASLFVILFTTIYFSKKYFNSLIIGIATIAIYTTTTGVMRQHVFYTADLDAILCVFIYFIILIRTKQLVSNKIETIEIYLIALFFGLSYLTKSLASIFILPSLILSFLFEGTLNGLLKNKHTYFALILFLLIGLSYYFVRIPTDPQFWNVVWESEYKRLFYNVMPWNTAPWYHYFETLWTSFFKYQLILMTILGSIYLYIPKKNILYKRCIIHLLVLCFGFILFISIADSKMDFYIAPLYSAFSLIISLKLFEIFTYFKNKKCLNEYGMILIILLLFAPPACATVIETKDYAKSLFTEESDSNLLVKVIKEYPSSKNIKIVCYFAPWDERHYDVINYYKKLFNYNNNTNIDIVNSLKFIRKHDTIIVNQSPLKDSILSSNKFSKLDELNGAFLMIKIKE